jgi:hypothetical protein
MICISRHGRVLSVTLLCLGFAACGEDSGPSIPMFEVTHNEASSRLHVSVYPGLEEGQSLYMRVRQGPVGVLECDQMLGDLDRIDGVVLSSDGEKDSFEGASVDPAIYDMQDPYDASWLEQDENGAPMRGHSDIAAIEATFHTIDLCLFNADGSLARGAEMDIQRALDVAGTGKFDGYGDANERIVSVTAYAQACVAQIGDIPFFPQISEGDYETYSCLDSTPIPMTVTPTNPVTCEGDLDCVGSTERCSDNICVDFPETASRHPINGGPMCDNPQYIYSSCEPNAVSGRTNGPRVANRTNEQGTEWILLCRKALSQEGRYNDVAMLGHNPYTGVTCFFQNALYSRTDGLHVPHPADEVDSPQSPQQSTSMWSGIQGGIGSGIECVTCHDADPIVHTPWIDGAKDANGDPVLPKMGIRDGFAEGFNDAPYSLVNLEGQGWTMPKHLVSEEAAACTKCHRMGQGRWARQWLRRLEGTDDFWNDLHSAHGTKFEHLYWMPPEMEGLDEATWPESEFGKALDFIQGCYAPGENTACKWVDLPTEQVTYEGEPVTTDLQGKELAIAALKALGASVGDSSDEGCDKETPDGQNNSCANQRCAECHSVGEGGLKHWLTLYKRAQYNCKLDTPIEGMDRSTALQIVNCMRATPEDTTSVFAAEKMGMMATGARFGYFRQLFQLAYTEDQWLREYILFKSRVNMPKGTYSAFSEMEYAVVQKWFDSGLQHVGELLISQPPPPPCPTFEASEWASDTLAAYIEEMKYDGWGAVNKEAGIAMYGCETTTDATQCFASAVDHTETWGNGVGSLKEVIKLSFKTSFWTRSSADGRYIGNGGGHSGGATITDMVNSRDIKVKASYDPGFFPDNSGFIYQGGGTKICSQSTLETAEVINFETPGCIRGTNINLYQHVARGLNGGDYFIINSQFTSDSGRNATKDPVANFDAGSSMKFSPMIFTGTTYEQLSPDVVDSPFEGDSVLSPSTRLVISRQGGGENGSSLGYVIRKVNAQKEGSGYTVTLGDQMARVCMPGAKANISFDERFFVTHHYEGGTSNIHMVDMLTQQAYQITDVPQDTKALFPHFRSDGWFYFLMRTGEDEFVVASDFAVKLAAGAPEATE